MEKQTERTGGVPATFTFKCPAVTARQLHEIVNHIQRSQSPNLIVTRSEAVRYAIEFCYNCGIYKE